MSAARLIAAACLALTVNAFQQPSPVVRRSKERASVSISDKAGLKINRQTQATVNPSGCSVPRTKEMNAYWQTFWTKPGTYPVDEFKNLLETRKGVVAFVKNASWDRKLSKELNLTWCPEPRGAVLADLDNASAAEYLQHELQGADPKKPLIITSIEIFGANDYHLLQVSNFLCGLKRLGLTNQVAIFALSNTSAVALRTLHPWLKVLWHPALQQMLKNIGHHTHIRSNRLAKLAFAELILRMKREVLVSDLDTYWFQDPIPQLQAMQTPSGESLDVVAMADSCWLELNSGFVYYKPTARAHHLLYTALMTHRFETDHPKEPGTKVRLVSDNDQYLLNCGLARAAIGGLKYAILPRDSFTFGPWYNDCVNKSRPKRPLLPQVWHTGGFQSPYEDHIDRFAVMGLMDFDAKTSQCMEAPRGSTEDATRARDMLARLCDTSPGGYMTTACQLQCPGGRKPLHAQAILAQQTARKELDPTVDGSVLQPFLRRRRRRRTNFPEPDPDLQRD